MEDRFDDMIRRVWNHAPCQIIMVERIDGTHRYGNLYVNRTGTKVAFGDLTIDITQAQLIQLCCTATSKSCEHLFELSRKKYDEVETGVEANNV